MKRNKMFRWLAPGIRIKRWLLLFAVGVGFLIFGALMMTNYQWLSIVEDMFLQTLYKLTGSYDYTVLATFGFGALVVGIILMYYGSKNMVRTIVRAIIPQDSNAVGDYIFQNIRLRQGAKIVVIGGGTGLSTLLRGLKTKTSNLTAIVTVADDGGSSGRLREDLKMIAPGDLRNCLVALADTEGLMEKLFRYRFSGEGDLSGHSFGNLFLAALTQVLNDDIEEALDASSKILKVRGRVIPSTTETVVLSAEFEDGSVIRGESQIPYGGKRIKRVFLEPQGPKAEGSALQAIDEADMIVIGPGSLYTSIMPNLLVDKVVEHLQASKAHKMYVCNVMTQPGETTGYSVADHVQAIYDHGGPGIIDTVLVNDAPLSDELLKEYKKSGSAPVPIDTNRLEQMGLRLIRANLMKDTDKAAHDSDRLGKVVMDIVYALDTAIEPDILEYYLRREDH